MAKELTPLQRTSQLMNGEAVQKKFQQMLGERAPQFISSVLSAVSANPMLQNATPESVYGSAIMAATLDLPINGNLGFAYIVPFNCKKKDPQTGQWYSKVEAQFQMGSKGFIQLAMRSGQYLNITVNEVYEGELEVVNRFKEEYKFNEPKSDKVVGYMAYFKLVNGFEKYMYMSVEDLQKHGKMYSKTYDKENGQWATNFDGMARKTVIKRLLSKFGILTIDMQHAQVYDQGVVSKTDESDIQDAEVVYVDNDHSGQTATPEQAEVANDIQSRVAQSMNKQS